MIVSHLHDYLDLLLLGTLDWMNSTLNPLKNRQKFVEKWTCLALI